MNRGLDVLRDKFVLGMVNSGLEILRKNGWDFNKSIGDVYFNAEIIPIDQWAEGKKDPTETNFEEGIIRLREDYVKDNKYKWFTDEFGWAAHEFFHAYVSSKKGWNRNQMDFYDFFLDGGNGVYPANFEEFIPFSGQFAVMIIKNTDGNIPHIIADKKADLVFETYLNIAKSANLNN